LDYNRGLLSPLESATVKAHLESCPHCRQVLEGEIRLVGRLEAVPQVAPSRDVWSRVESRVRSERRPLYLFGVAWTMFARRMAAGVAALALFAVLLVISAPWKPDQSQVNSVRQAATLMQVQPNTQPTDDQLTRTSDDMLKVLENEL
jgi:anti-sigma factor RsiW